MAAYALLRNIKSLRRAADAQLLGNHEEILHADIHCCPLCKVTKIYDQNFTTQLFLCEVQFYLCFTFHHVNVTVKINNMIKENQEITVEVTE